MKSKDITSRLALAFVCLLVIGTLAFLVTGKTLFLGLGVVSAVAVMLLWSVSLAIRIIKPHLKAKRYLEVMITGAFHGGILLLMIYFFWFLLSKMLGVRIFGEVPQANTSSLTFLGAFLIFFSAVISFVRAAFGRKKHSRPHQH